MATPSNLCETILPAAEFRDKLRDRYEFVVLNYPSHCDGCNSKNSIKNSLSCKKGGLIHARYDESHDSLGCLACAKFQLFNVRDEPQINPCHILEGRMNAKVKLSSRVIWAQRWK